ncbi:MAG TPA: response regulator [Bacilli bacterium]
MGYKALIVDDEPIIRHGLASCVDWAGMDLELVGEAGNGESALDIVREREVDILITDIKMPKMDGLEFIRRGKQCRPHLKAILISSYSDFEYARQAVQLGVVVDYLLKPTMEPEDLIRLLDECRHRLDEELTLEEQSLQYAQEQERKKRQGAGTEIKKLLSGQPADVNRIGEVMSPPFVLSVWRLEPAREERKPSDIERISQMERTAEALTQLFPGGAVCVTKEDELVMLLPDPAGTAARAIRDSHGTLLAQGVRFTVGISPSFHRPDRLTDAYGWAENAFVHAFFRGGGRCYDGEIKRAAEREMPQDGPGREEDAAAIRDRFSRGLADLDREGCEIALCRLFDLWRSGAYTPDEIRKQAGDLLIILEPGPFYLKAEEKLQRLMAENEKVRRAFTLDEICRLVLAHFRSSWEVHALSPFPKDTGGQHAVQAAIAYIQEHYRGDLSLQEVADHVHMSKNYFSEQFKRRTGMGFVDFVIRLRIQYARHLLETTTLKIYDIGSHCGFNSPKHFLKLFKREAGCTPAEYRYRIQSKGEAR